MHLSTKAGIGAFGLAPNAPYVDYPRVSIGGTGRSSGPM